jgi:hypothetical protein
LFRTLLNEINGTKRRFCPLFYESIFIPCASTDIHQDPIGGNPVYGQDQVPTGALASRTFTRSRPATPPSTGTLWLPIVQVALSSEQYFSMDFVDGMNAQKCTRMHNGCVPIARPEQ